ncbi:MAG: hypothetical protein ABW034_14315 [Steroidobacteraceae bacterium]
MSNHQQALDAWTTLCRALESAGRNVLASAPDSLDAGEGLRFLTRALRFALERQMEGADADFPLLTRSSHETLKLMSDSPDYYYEIATISGAHDYRIRTTRGSGEVLAFSTYGRGPAGVMCTGEFRPTLEQFDANGICEFVASTRSRGSGWLPMDGSTFFMQVRNMCRDPARRDPAWVRIERIGAPIVPTPFTIERATPLLQAAAGQLNAIVGSINAFRDGIRARVGVNAFDHDQGPWIAGGSLPSTYYIQAVYELEEDEALEIETDVPENSYFSVQLNNHWVESLDYLRHRIHLSKYSAERERDGRLRIVVAHRSPGTANWLDTAGHRTGVIAWKWNDAEYRPQPSIRRVQP